MVEVELKVRAGHRRVREVLLRLGARPLGRVREEDLYFEAPHRDFRLSDEALRIRVEGAKATLAYKGPKVDHGSKSREELEVELGDWRLAREILLRLGFREVRWVKKERERYLLGSMVVALDRVEGLGEFVEVEAKTSGGYGHLVQEARKLLESLGLDPAQSIRRSYLELLLEGNP